MKSYLYMMRVSHEDFLFADILYEPEPDQP